MQLAGQSNKFFLQAKAATNVSCIIRLTVAAAAGYEPTVQFYKASSTFSDQNKK